MGGTFDILHRGHRALLDAAFAAGDERVSIGITTDAFASGRRTRSVRPYDARVADVKSYLASKGLLARAEIRPIDTPVGFAAEAGYDAVAVTEETAATADIINKERAKLGRPPLAVVMAPYVLADDARPIKATRIAKGEIDAEGRLRRAARVAIGSDNPVKVEAARRAATRLFGQAEVRGFAVASGVAIQPFEAETWEGAEERARAALAAWPECDFGVGIEAGLFDIEAIGETMDVQACVVVDHAGRATRGQGPGFGYPAHVVEQLRLGRSVGDIVAEMSGIADIGKKAGAVGWLSRGHMTRTALTEPAVLMAFLPRLRPELYGL